MTSHPQRVFPPDFGVFAATCRSFNWEGRKISVVHFWPAHVAHGELDIGQAYFYELPDYIFQTAVGTSGRYMLILVHSEDEGEHSLEGYLGLLHFTSTPTPHTTFRKLDIGELSPDSCDQIALDDSLGLVLVVDHTGKVTVISYV